MPAPPPPPAWTSDQQAVAESGRLSGFWLRFAAYVVDAAIVTGILLVLGGVLFVIGVIAYGSLDEADADPVFTAFAVMLALGMVVISWLYEALMTSSPSGATLGKQVAGIRILRANGAQLSFARATGRHFAKYMITPWVPLAIGYIMAAFTARKQALHDMIADTLVMETTGGQQHRPAATSSAGIVQHGGFWLRLVACVIDSIVLLIAATIIGMLVGMSLTAIDAFQASRYAEVAIVVVLSWLYFSFMESSPGGATLGKMAVGLRVVTGGGEPLTFAKATGRYFAKYVSAAILGIGFIMAAFTDRKRGLHDMMADTLVVRTP
jgi:uncharacterized RDD family membrane protein YckC